MLLPVHDALTTRSSRGKKGNRVKQAGDESGSAYMFHVMPAASAGIT